MNQPLKEQVNKIENDTKEIKNIGDELTDLLNKLEA